MFLHPCFACFRLQWCLGGGDGCVVAILGRWLVWDLLISPWAAFENRNEETWDAHETLPPSFPYPTLRIIARNGFAKSRALLIKSWENSTYVRYALCDLFHTAEVRWYILDEHELLVSLCPILTVFWVLKCRMFTDGILFPISDQEVSHTCDLSHILCSIASQWL